MAQAATVYTFDIQLSDMDRGVYETLSVRAARQPSETEEYLLTRVLAYCLEYAEGLAFSRGLAEPDEPALAVRELDGTLRAWIDIGAPNATRLHKASKLAPRVAVYTHKDVAPLLRQWGEGKIFRIEALEIHAVDRSLLAELARRLERRMSFALAVSDRHLYLTLDDASLSGAVISHSLGRG